MRSRWFHAPLLHTEHHASKRVSWLELFFDLVFVAALLQLGLALGDSVAADGASVGLSRFALHFAPLWTAWTGFTFYANRFDVDDFVHRTMVLLMMLAIGAIGVAAPAAMASVDPQPTPFALAFAAAQALVALMYLRAYKHATEARAYSAFWGSVFAAGAVLWVVSVLLPQPWNYAFWVLGAVAVLVAPLSRASLELRDRYPLDQAHLGERYALLTLLVLGESFVAVLGGLATEHGVATASLVKGAVGLLLLCCVWWIYFDDVAGSKLREGRGGWLVWFLSHLPLTLGIVATGVGIQHALSADLSQRQDEGFRFLLSGSLGLTFLSVSMIDAVTERRQAELSDRARVNLRLASGVALLLLSQAGAFMVGSVFLGLVMLICVAQVVFDMVMAPLEDAGDHDEARTTAELARDRAAGVRAADTRRRPDVGTAVKRGMPSELRGDLYAFFMEGSWTRALFLLAAGFVALNVVFALLFLLDPGGITGSEGGFVDAFAFSVQTMATIGYGALSPSTTYVDMVVTLEAALSMVLVALSTGLMFAKASRPVARVLFSEVLTLTTWDGKPTLVLRVGNARNTEIVDATISWLVLKDEITVEGHHIRRLHDLELVRSRSPMFVLSWTVQHVIDEDSPLYGVDFTAESIHDLAFVVTLVGHDATYGQTSHSRRMYQGGDVRVGHHFVDVMSQLPDGRMLIDYDLFHKTAEDV